MEIEKKAFIRQWNVSFARGNLLNGDPPLVMKLLNKKDENHISRFWNSLQVFFY